jgi:hypothetical protein
MGMVISKRSFVASVLLSGAFLFGQTPTDGPTIKSAQAKAAIAKADKAEEAAAAAYRKALADVRRVELTELRAAMASATKAGNLDEANAINAAISRLEAEAKETASAADGRLSGTFRVMFDGRGPERLYVFDGRGGVRYADVGNLDSVVEGKLIGGTVGDFEFANKVERWTRVGDRVFVELFKSGNDKVVERWASGSRE